MALVSPADQQQLREAFADLKRPVRLLFFTRPLDCETCLQTRQILNELPLLSDRITIDEVNFVLDADRVTEYAINRVPAIAITYEQDEKTVKDSRIRFVGTPAGYDFVSLVQAILLVGGRESILSGKNHARVMAVDEPVRIRVFSTPT